MCKEAIDRNNMKLTSIENKKLPPVDEDIVLKLIKQDEITKRFEPVEAYSETTCSIASILSINQSEHHELVSEQVQIILSLLETNKQDPLQLQFLNESLQYVTLEMDEYFNQQQIDAYFHSSPGNSSTLNVETPQIGFNPYYRPRKKSMNKHSEVYFYQDQNGSTTYLHDICFQLLEKQVGGQSKLPTSIKVLFASEGRRK